MNHCYKSFELPNSNYVTNIHFDVLLFWELGISKIEIIANMGQKWVI